MVDGLVGVFGPDVHLLFLGQVIAGGLQLPSQKALIFAPPAISYRR